MTHGLRTCVIVFAGILATGVAAGQARTPAATQTDVLGALLTEVRALRTAMERMAVAGPRVQLALGRLQLQEQRVNAVLRRLEAIRVEAAQAQREYDDGTVAVRSLQQAIREATDPVQRKEYESAFQEHQRQQQRTATNLQRLQGEETALNAEISAEQTRWNDINRRLEELENALGRQ
jgi:predicted  nucleic acid-binding Zn-ribbon protein